MQGLSSNGLPSSTSRWISLNMTATEELYKSWYSVFEGTHRLLNWHLQHWHRPWSCTLVERPFWRTFEQNLAHSSLVHDERGIHNNVSFEVLIWLPIVFPLYLEDNLLWTQSCPWYHCPQWPRPQIPDCWKVYQLLAHANLWVILPSFCQTSPRKSLHVNLRPHRHSSPTEVEHIL